MKPLFDSKAPKSLTDIQSWFASIITQKMQDGFEIAPTTLSGESIVNEAKKYILENDRLPAHLRMELYCQSYWLRLLAALHEEFPFLLRLFGENDFNIRLGVPYLDTCPPDHWSLNALGNRFVQWLEANYRCSDKNFIINAAKLDWAYQECFFKKPLPPIHLKTFSGEKAELLFSEPLILQSYVHLFSFSSHLLNFREAFLKQPAEFWITNDFPKLCKEREYYFVIYRGMDLHVEWEELSCEEYQLLLHIKEGNSIETAIAKSSIDQQLLEKNLAFWVQKWLLKQWISLRAQVEQFALQVVDERQTDETSQTLN